MGVDKLSLKFIWKDNRHRISNIWRRKKLDDRQYSVSRLTINLRQPRQHSIKGRIDTQTDGTHRESRNKPTQTELTDLWQREQRKFNGERIAFSINGDETIGFLDF